MKSHRLPKHVFYALLCTTLCLPGLLHADPVTWDGGAVGGPNSSGNWGDDLNWSSDAEPTSADEAILGNVTAGTRIVTFDSGVTNATIQQLNMDQTTVGAVNQLTLNRQLTLTNTNPFVQIANASAGVGSVRLDLNGQTLSMASNFTSETIANTIAFSSAGSILEQTSGSNAALTLNFIGSVQASASGIIQRRFTGGSSSTSFTVNYGTAGNFTDSNLNVSAGTLTHRLTGTSSNSGRSISVNVTNTASIANGAGITVENNGGGNFTGAANLTVAATGTLTQAGDVAMRAKSFSTDVSTGGTSAITNNGVWIVSGTGATITKLTTTGLSTQASTPTFTNANVASAIIRGSSSNDVLEFNEESTSSNRMTLVNNRVVAAGAGTGGAGLSSVGTLTLRDMNLTLSGVNSVVQLDIGGFALGEFDRLVLENGVTAGAGAGVLDLSTVGDTLAISFTNGYTPTVGTSWTLLGYGSVVGEFDNFTITGTADSFASNTANYQLTYGANSATLTLVPEPGVLPLAALALAGIISGRRRARRA